jgi:prepilin-type N-terminal cleavage/methylation domain-containing protein
MNQPVSPDKWRVLPPDKRNRGFTLTELAVVIATLAVLAMVVLPALAGPQNKAGRIQCAANLRQISVASMIYANQYRGWLPIWGGFDFAHPVNQLNGMHYSRYVFQGPAANSPVSTNGPTAPGSPQGTYENMGYLYRAGLAGKGQIFFCPDQWGSPFGANGYLPLLTTDSGGVVRSSYTFNPRLSDAASDFSSGRLRRYQKTSDLVPHKLLCADYFGAIGSGGNPGSPSSSLIPHSREHGWNVLFTDGSVQFSRNDQAYNLILTDQGLEAVNSYITEDQIMNYLELDH